MRDGGENEREGMGRGNWNQKGIEVGEGMKGREMGRE